MAASRMNIQRGVRSNFDADDILDLLANDDSEIKLLSNEEDGVSVVQQDVNVNDEFEEDELAQQGEASQESEKV
ncbi:unnamed protein product [Timema podura]|uniref:Uncharacterized protein n=1 Tax=Timema podura TaxID=61482 RepID=A0ABN7P817_TIMPD|nr:unnamed protein product [Timema podura]